MHNKNITDLVMPELDNEDFEQLYEDGNITIGAFAHQEEGLDYETALAAAIKHFEMTDLK